MVHHVRKESIEDLKGCIYFNVLIRIHKLEYEIEQILPYDLLLFIYCASYFYKEIADFVNNDLVITIGDGF
jgi:hypothetical protein